MTISPPSEPAIPRRSYRVDDVARLRAAHRVPDAGAEQDERWSKDLLELFLRGQVYLAPVMPFLSLLIAFTALRWAPLDTVIAWTVGALGTHAIQVYLCHDYFKKSRTPTERAVWVGKITASEFLQAMCWVTSLYIFWPQSNMLDRAFLIAALMAANIVRFLIVSNYMPVLVAGTCVIALGIAARCIAEGGPIGVSLALLIIVLQAFFLFIARQMQDVAREMCQLRADKDDLIVELESERDKANAERQKAETANDAKSAFLANMSHELRTPLNAILGFSEILAREILGPLQNGTYKSYAGDIHSSGKHLLELINDILDLSRIEAGRAELREEPMSVFEAAETAKGLLDLRAHDKRIIVDLVIPQELPRIMADRRAINQVVINLLTNAVKFTQHGGKVVISATVADSGSLSLSVKDNGPGIPAHELSIATSAFARGSLATKKAIDGAGLGLPIVRGLVALHGGTMEIKSTPGSGTEVICTLPSYRVLSGPRGEILATADAKTDTQRTLIQLTG
jgi:two-component system, cell cycle sensor histidine kinase PleC